MSKLKKDFGIRALFGSLIILGWIVSVLICLGNNNMEMLKAINDTFANVTLVVISFYFGQSNRKIITDNNKE